MSCCSLRTVMLQGIVLVALGTGLGLVDSVLRPIKLDRPAPPPIPTSTQGPATSPKPEVPAPGPGTSTTNPPAQPAPAAPKLTSGGPDKPVKPFDFTPVEKLGQGQVTVLQAKSLFDADAAFIDARRKDDYETLHVARAFRMDAKAFLNGDPVTLGLIERSRTIVVYCGGGNCDESENVARLIANSGYQKVYVMKDGIPGWEAAGYPTETGQGVQP